MNLTAGSMKTCYMFKERFEIVNTFPSYAYVVNHVVVCVVNAIITITTVCLNTLTLLTFWKSSRLKQKACYTLIVVQSFIDLGVGMIGSTIYTFLLANEIAGTGSCGQYLASRKMSMLLTILSISTLSGMNIERYISVVHPITHRNRVTRKSQIIYVTCIYFLCIIMLALSFVLRRAFATFVISLVIFFLGTTAYIYIKIFVAATLSNTIIPLQNEFLENSSSCKRKRKFLREIRLAKPCFLVVTCTFLCFLPAAVLGGSNSGGFKNSVLKYWSVTLTMLNPSLNSVIFFWKNATLRNELKTVLRGICRS